MNMINVLENYNLNKYIEVKNVKEKVKERKGLRFTMMSGSGPTIVGFFDEMSDAKDSAMFFREEGYDAYYVTTMD